MPKSWVPSGLRSRNPYPRFVSCLRSWKKNAYRPCASRSVSLSCVCALCIYLDKETIMSVSKKQAPQVKSVLEVTMQRGSKPGHEHGTKVKAVAMIGAVTALGVAGNVAGYAKGFIKGLIS